MPYVDREKQKEYKNAWNKEYYRRNTKQEIKRVATRKAKLRDWLNEYRKSTSCSVCGESDPACLDFHHTNPKEKEFSLGDTKASGFSKKRLLNEIQKCVVVCANCHRKAHARSVK